MGCCEGCGQVLLVLINLLFSLIGIVLLVVSCLVRFGSDLLDTYLRDAYSAFQKAIQSAAAQQDFDISGLDIGDIIGDASIGFIVIGAFFFILGIFGCIGAICKVKFLLIVYTIVLMTIFVAELVFVILLAAAKSTVDGWIRTPLIKKLKDDYSGTSGTDPFTLTINFVMHEFKCCGIDNYTEFENADKWNQTRGGQKVPSFCCRDVTNKTVTKYCTENPTSNNSYIDEGCYKAVNNWVKENSSVLIGVGAGVAAVQLILIVFSMVIYCKRRHEDDEKKGEHIGIHPYRESPEARGHQNFNYTGPPSGSHNDIRYDNGPRTPASHYNDRDYPEPYRGRTDYYTGPPEGYGNRDPYRR